MSQTQISSTKISPKKPHSFWKSFQFAFDGIWYNLKNEVNMRVHLIVTVLVVAAGLFFRISIVEWWILLVFFALVPALELINTAIEIMCDVMRDECGGSYENLGTPRDLAAGAVLWATIFAVITGLMIFGPRFLQLF